MASKLRLASRWTAVLGGAIVGVAVLVSAAGPIGRLGDPAISPTGAPSTSHVALPTSGGTATTPGTTTASTASPNNATPAATPVTASPSPSPRATPTPVPVGPTPSFLARTFPIRDLAWNQLFPGGQQRQALTAAAPVDENGVPMRNWEGVLYYSPSRIAVEAIRRLSQYVQTGDSRYLDVVETWAAKLQQLAVPVGDALWLPFPYDNPREKLTAPWYNALAQGVSLSLFSRLHRITGDAAYLATATGLFQSFEQVRAPGGAPWAAQVDKAGYLWFEHYAGGALGHVLNAHLYAIFGLRDYWQEVHTAEALRVLQGGITTMRDNARKYRRPGTFSYYCLINRIALPQYHSLHIGQLRYLAIASGDSYFARLADTFARDYAAKPKPKPKGA